MFKRILESIAIFLISFAINFVVLALIWALYLWFGWHNSHPVVPEFDMDAVIPKMGQ